MTLPRQNGWRRLTTAEPHASRPNSFLSLAASGRRRIHTAEEFLHGADRSGVGGDIPGKRRNRLVKFAAFHDTEHALHRLGLQKRTAADEEIILGQKPDEIQPELPGCG